MEISKFIKFVGSFLELNILNWCYYLKKHHCVEFIRCFIRQMYEIEQKCFGTKAQKPSSDRGEKQLTIIKWWKSDKASEHLISKQ